MAEPHEPSYYEIALTNRQVVVAFVILLTCLLGAFFSGVWIGRESTARAAQEQIVRNTPPSEAAQDGKNLEELEFFDQATRRRRTDKDRERKDGRAGRPAGQHPARGPRRQEAAAARSRRRPPAPPSRTAPAGRAGARRARPGPGAAQPPQGERSAAAAAAAATPGGGRRRPPRRRQATPARTAAAKAGQGPPRRPPSAKGSYVIQVFSSADQAQAERIRGKLAGGGQKAYLSPIDRGGRTMYRVRIGPFKSRDDAQKVADKVRKGYKLDTWVTE